MHLRGILRRALNWAIRLGLLSRNVAALARPPRLERHEIEPFTPDEARSFLTAIEGDRLEGLYIAALFSGLRQGELLGLRWQDVDLEAQELRVVHALQRFDGKLRLVPPKTARSRRSVSLPPLVVDALRRDKARQLEDRLLAGSRWVESGLVYTTRWGTPIEPRDATRSFKRLLARAQLREIRFHDLRHSCATLLLVQGVAPRVVMEMLGHSQISVTMNTYSHVLPALQRDAAQRLEALLRPS
ncbi:MAG TPA: site-specific integrase [Candidatus Dormibacteraeota bacterium]